MIHLILLGGFKPLCGHSDHRPVKSSFLPEFFIALIHVDQPGNMFRQSSTSQSPMTLVSWRSSVEDVEVLRHL